MTITNHLLASAEKRIIPGGAVMDTRRFLVLHFTAGMSAESSIEWWLEAGTSAHLIIDRSGKVFQCRPFNRTAGHAGVSAWRDPKTGTLYRNLNTCSIGIEFANAGASIKNGLAFGKYPAQVTNAAHKWTPGKIQPWEEFSDAQLDVGLKIAMELVRVYNLDDVVGHEDIAPPGLRPKGDWKPDPGPLFPMRSFRFACGFTKPIGKLL